MAKPSYTYFATIAIPSERSSTPGTTNYWIEYQFNFVTMMGRDLFVAKYPRKQGGKPKPYLVSVGRNVHKSVDASWDRVDEILKTEKLGSTAKELGRLRS